jgi:hypothetical protein
MREQAAQETFGADLVRDARAVAVDLLDAQVSHG